MFLFLCIDSSNADRGICYFLLWGFSFVICLLTMPFSLCFCLKFATVNVLYSTDCSRVRKSCDIQAWSTTVRGSEGTSACHFFAGMFFILPCIDSYQKVDLRVVSFDVPPQEILTKDSVTIAVDAVVYFRIYNATMSITNVENANRSTRLLAQTTLRNVLGTRSLSEILTERDSISHVMQTALDEATDPWGVKVERVEVKDVRLPQQLQRAMAAEAEATREARAKVIAAEGEMNASRSLKDAADIIAENPQAIQLRYLHTLTTISAEKNSTIIFPLPIDFLSRFLPDQ
ncbi:hypothetical protein QZH41_014409 [Actinostola sp. cb2023]|nr:hypothetical protein QZH41_014409 [Actinostola sp. cb2023]